MVFGRLVDGLLTLRKIENTPTGINNRPKVGRKTQEMEICDGGDHYFSTSHFYLL